MKSHTFVSGLIFFNSVETARHTIFLFLNIFQKFLKILKI